MNVDFPAFGIPKSPISAISFNSSDNSLSIGGSPGSQNCGARFCAVANLATGCALWDVVFGTLATTLGALGTYYIGRKYPYAGPAFPIAANALIVPKVLQVVYGAEGTYWYFMLTVGIGEILSCGVLGIILYRMLKKTKIFEG